MVIRTRAQNQDEQLRQHEQRGQDRVWDFMIYGLNKTNTALNNVIMELNEYLSYTRNIRTLANNQLRRFVIEVLNRCNRLHTLKDKYEGMGNIGEVYTLRVREINQLETRVQIFMRAIDKEIIRRNANNIVYDIGYDIDHGYYRYLNSGRRI